MTEEQEIIYSFEQEYKMSTMAKKACTYAAEHDYEIVFSYLIGSQNYGINTAASDIDIECVVVPSLEYTATHTKIAINDTFEGPYGLIKMRDFRSFFLNDLPKSSLSTLEVFATRFATHPIKYSNILDRFMDIGKEICYTNPKAAVSTALGYAQQMRNRIFKEKEKNYNPELGYNPKIFSHYMRAYTWLDRYLNNTEDSIDDVAELYYVGDDENIVKAKLGQLPKETVLKTIEAFDALDEKNKAIPESAIIALTSRNSDSVKEILKEICIDIARIAWERKEEE